MYGHVRTRRDKAALFYHGRSRLTIQCPAVRAHVSEHRLPSFVSLILGITRHLFSAFHTKMLWRKNTQKQVNNQRPNSTVVTTSATTGARAKRWENACTDTDTDALLRTFLAKDRWGTNHKLISGATAVVGEHTIKHPDEQISTCCLGVRIGEGVVHVRKGRRNTTQGR